ncbi:hypothetical protein Purlil1_13375 [Purpureocillium lilacinum]|uniref:EGF domain-specific O-linked N-acetylglucosamine transferase n=1 Tax=Purpureocillium lilacinum TaxID=33203 RepID=A0ABR0BE84_PURLI|nr:hypothetical protein Purlil1_13375 [Purpureocillium lilacinum]
MQLHGHFSGIFAQFRSGADAKIVSLHKAPGLPLDHHPDSASEPLWCQDRFGARYLGNAAKSALSLCSRESSSRFTCFMSRTAHESARVDAMCHGRGAVFDESLRQFRLGCEPRPLTSDELARRVPNITDGLPRYWYETGPGVVMEKAVLLDKTVPAGRPQITTILVKREGSDHPWHSLMEIMSLSWSLDVLQRSVDAETGESFITPKSGAKMQVVLIDKHEEGPYIDMWRLFATMPIRRISDLNASEPASNIIIPFAGGSNTLWQGDWEELLCRDSTLVKTFVSRVLALYKVVTPTKHDSKVIVTFVRRTNTRKLVDEDAHMQALRDRISHMELRIVDFGTIPFAQQLEIAQQTDLLVGVHGAGLTHSMFLQPGSAVLEILPEGLQQRGFRNLAQMLGIDYFSAHARVCGDATGEDRWQFNNVAIDQQRLVSLVNNGVERWANSDRKSHDVI